MIVIYLGAECRFIKLDPFYYTIELANEFAKDLTGTCVFMVPNTFDHDGEPLKI